MPGTDIRPPSAETGPLVAETPPRGGAHFWYTLTRLEREKVQWAVGLRNGLGIVLPLAVAAAMGSLSAGIIFSTGALNVSFSDGTDGYRQRGKRMLAASACVALAVFLGSASGHHFAFAVALAAFWAFATGMLVAVGTTAADIGTISLVTLIVFSAQPMEWHQAALSGLGAFGGGLLQTVLALAGWPVRRYEPERLALSNFFSELARVAASPAPAALAPPASAESTSAQQALSSLTYQRSVESERYLLLLQQAERMRLSLLTLARLRTRLERENLNEALRATLAQALLRASGTLERIAQVLTDRSPIQQETPPALELESAQFSVPSDAGPAVSAMLEDTRHQWQALAGQLRAAWELASAAMPGGLQEYQQRESLQPWHLRLSGNLATLRANLSLRSATFRHAIRLATAVAIGDLVAHRLMWQRSYWLTMTVVIVLKPDFTATFSRGVLRLAGTFAGLLLATALVHLLPAGLAAQIALIGVLILLLRGMGPANYGILVTAVTAMVVILVGLTGVPPQEVISARGWSTLVGGVIALVIYGLWPTWERTQVRESLARMLDAYRDYFRAIRTAYEQPSSPFEAELDRARQAARLERSNLEASVERLGAEPGLAKGTLDALAALLASSHRLVHACMSLEAALARSKPVPPRPPFRTFANDVELTLYYLAAGLRGSPLQPGHLPDLRADHQALIHSPAAAADRYALVNVETDRITNSLNTFSEALLQWLKIGTARRGTPAR